MSQKIKRIVSILLLAVFAVAMLASCDAINVANTDPVVLKVNGKEYKLSAYKSLYFQHLSTYPGSDAEAEYCPNYAKASTEERTAAYREYVYDKLIEQAVKEYIVEKNDLLNTDKLNDADKEAINKLVDEEIESGSSSYIDKVTDDKDLAYLKKEYGSKVDKDELEAALTKVDSTFEQLITNKIASIQAEKAAEEAKTDSDSAAPAETAAPKDEPEATEEEQAQLRAEAVEALCKDRELSEKTEEALRAAVEEEAEKSVYFSYYAQDKAKELYADGQGHKTVDELKKDLFETKKETYVYDTKIAEVLGVKIDVKDGDIKAYIDEKVKASKESFNEEDSRGTFATSLKNKLETRDSNKEENYASIDDVIWYVPANSYGYVRHLLLLNDEELKSAASDTATDEKETDLVAYVKPELKAEVEAAIADINAKAAEDTEFDIQAEFKALIEKYGEDKGMKAEDSLEKGFFVGLGSKDLVEPFVNGSVKLIEAGKPGAISEEVVSQYGVHYIQLVNILDEEEATADTLNIKDLVIEQIKSEKIDAAVSVKLTAEQKELKINKYKNRIKRVITGYESSLFI